MGDTPRGWEPREQAGAGTRAGEDRTGPRQRSWERRGGWVAEGERPVDSERLPGGGGEMCPGPRLGLGRL